MKKLMYQIKDYMTPLMKTRLAILNVITESGLTTAEIVFLLDSIKHKTLLAEVLTYKEVFKKENQFLSFEKEKEEK